MQKNKPKIHWIAVCLLFLSLQTYAQIGMCLSNCENAYNDDMNTAFSVYLACINDPPVPGGIGACMDNWYAAQSAAHIQREYCRLGCQGGGSPSNPGNVSITSTDLVKINQESTSSGLVEIKILSVESGYQQYSLQTTIPIPTAPIGQWEFAFGIESNRNQRPDLFCFKKTGTSSGMMEVHVLSGVSNYQSFIAQKTTTLPVSSDEWEFVVGAPNTNLDPTMYNVQPSPPYDVGGRIIAVQKNGTASGNSEISVLEYGPSNNYQVRFSVVLPLIETDKNWRFGTGDWNGDTVSDLMAINHTKTTSGDVEITVFDGANSYTPIIQTPVPFTAQGGWSYFPAQALGMGDDEPEFFAVNRAGSGGNTLLNIYYDAFYGYPYAYLANQSTPLAPDIYSEFLPAPSYSCSICPQ